MIEAEVDEARRAGGVGRPQALKKASPPPKVAAPKLSAGTRNPEWPSRLKSNGVLQIGVGDKPRGSAAATSP